MSAPQSLLHQLRFLPLLAVLLILSSCTGNRFVTRDFKARTASHERIAVLPYEVTYTGRRDPKLSDEDYTRLIEQEAFQYQQNLVLQLLRFSNSKRGMQVDVVDAKVANQRMLEAGIDPVNAMDVSIEELCAILDVDAVIGGTVIKHRQLSNLESAAVTAAQILVGGPAWFVPSNTYMADVAVSLIDANGVLLYSDRDELDVDFRTPVQEAVEQVNRRLMRRIPYR